MRIRKGDLLILVVLLIIGGYFFLNKYLGEEKIGNLAILEIDGETIESFNLNSDSPNYLANTDYGYNIIEFEAGKVRVVEADCPDQICVHFGWIEYVGQTIVCLPHRLIIRIANDSIDDGLDGVSY